MNKSFNASGFVLNSMFGNGLTTSRAYNLGRLWLTQLWPHPDLAEVCCFTEHKEMGAKPQAISLDSFIKNYIPDMISNDVYFGVFYGVERNGLAVEGGALKAALEEEVGSVWEC